jgi:hypothetical protein
MARTDALLSWNMGCFGSNSDPAMVQRRLDLLSEIVADYAPSLVALQEAPPIASVRSTLGAAFDIQQTTSGVTSAYNTLLWSCDHRDVSNRRIAVFGLQASGASTSLWMFNIHGPALYVDAEEKRMFIREVGGRLRTLRASNPPRSEIVVGDMNLPPFDFSLLRPDGLYANRCLPWVSDRSTGVDRALFNPTWCILGQHKGASGTFYTSNVGVDGPWLALDQVIVSAELADGLSLDIIEYVAKKALRRNGRIGTPNEDIGSDHLPLLAIINLP